MKKTLTKILAFVGVLAILGGATIGFMQLWAPSQYKPSNWGYHAQAEEGSDKNDGDADKDKDKEVGDKDDEGNGKNDGDEGKGDGEGNGEEEDDDEPISVTLEEKNGRNFFYEPFYMSVEVTATVKDVTAQYRDVEFSPDWESSRDAAVSDYVTMETEGNTATLMCIQAFDTPIILTATVTGAPDVSATYRLDYLRPFTICMNVGYDDEVQSYVSTTGSNLPGASGMGAVKGELKLDSIELILDSSSSINRAAFYKDGRFTEMAHTALFTNYLGTVTVPDTIKITDFSNVEEDGSDYTLSFNLNIFDFFGFSKWDYKTNLDTIRERCSGILLSCCDDSNTASISAKVSYSYMDEGDSVVEYSYSLVISVDFTALTNAPDSTVYNEESQKFMEVKL